MVMPVPLIRFRGRRSSNCREGLPLSALPEPPTGPASRPAAIVAAGPRDHRPTRRVRRPDRRR